MDKALQKPEIGSQFANRASSLKTSSLMGSLDAKDEQYFNKQKI